MYLISHLTIIYKHRLLCNWLHGRKHHENYIEAHIEYCTFHGLDFDYYLRKIECDDPACDVNGKITKFKPPFTLPAFNRSKFSRIEPKPTLNRDNKQSSIKEMSKNDDDNSAGNSPTQSIATESDIYQRIFRPRSPSFENLRITDTPRENPIKAINSSLKPVLSAADHVIHKIKGNNLFSNRSSASRDLKCIMCKELLTTTAPTASTIQQLSTRTSAPYGTAFRS